MTSCIACKSSLHRRQRRASIVGHLMLIIGFYPWECLNCGMSYYLHRISMPPNNVA
jgi:hypothetical protein